MNGTEYRDWVRLEFFVYPVLQNYVDFCYQWVCQSDGGCLDTQYPLFVYYDFSLPEGAAMNVLCHLQKKSFFCIRIRRIQKQ